MAGDGTPPHRDLAGVLHDVSNALTVLLGWVGEARAEAASPEDRVYALTIIEQRARVARDLARHAIGATRIDTPSAISLLSADVVGALRVEANRGGVTLDLQEAGDTEAEVAGSLDVSQVLTNLVLNALAYAPKGTAVDILISSDDEACTWIVADRGPGVPESQRAGIFQGESLRPGGVGIGLQHARALARAAGGDVELLDDAPGYGARFRVRWPRTDAVPRPPVSVSRDRGLIGMRILVVEDDTAVTQLLETALEARGAEVTLAGTSSELAAALDRSHGAYDAALIDLSPIAADVAGALARLRASSPGINLVLITGSADRLPEEVIAAGMTLVRKPFEVTELLASLKKPT